FNEECPCIMVHFLLDLDYVFEINILEFDSVLGFIKIKYPECPSVQVETDQYFIIGSEKIAYQLYGSHTAGCCKRSTALFKFCKSFFEMGACRISGSCVVKACRLPDFLVFIGSRCIYGAGSRSC